MSSPSHSDRIESIDVVRGLTVLAIRPDEYLYVTRKGEDGTA